MRDARRETAPQNRVFGFRNQVYLYPNIKYMGLGRPAVRHPWNCPSPPRARRLLWVRSPSRRLRAPARPAPEAPRPPLRAPPQQRPDRYAPTEPPRVPARARTAPPHPPSRFAIYCLRAAKYATHE